MAVMVRWASRARYAVCTLLEQEFVLAEFVNTRCVSLKRNLENTSSGWVVNCNGQMAFNLVRRVITDYTKSTGSITRFDARSPRFTRPEGKHVARPRQKKIARET